MRADGWTCKMTMLGMHTEIRIAASSRERWCFVRTDYGAVGE